MSSCRCLSVSSSFYCPHTFRVPALHEMMSRAVINLIKTWLGWCFPAGETPIKGLNSFLHLTLLPFWHQRHKSLQSDQNKSRDSGFGVTELESVCVWTRVSIHHCTAACCDCLTQGFFAYYHTNSCEAGFLYLFEVHSHLHLNSCTRTALAAHSWVKVPLWQIHGGQEWIVKCDFFFYRELKSVFQRQETHNLTLCNRG